MMRKVLFSLSVLAVATCYAAPLSPEQALSRVDDGEVGTRAAVSSRLLRTVNTPVGEPALYLFNNKDSRGFIVVSADDAVIPLLGYSDTGDFDEDNLPPVMLGWLEGYARQIEYARENGAPVYEEDGTRALPAWSAIAPLLKTQWNQEAPYNNLCPKYGSRSTPTGCVATAMSQVMKYFEYPAKGQGSISYNCSSLGRDLSLDFSTLTFDWANMLNNYNGQSTQAQQTAVATLMQAAGYSVQMDYNTAVSGAISALIPNALSTYFGYDSSAVYVPRSEHTYTEWATLIYENLKNNGPVIYDGDSSDFQLGHSFVCDGYSNNGYFHFNWGWGGAGDGYFQLDALNPAVIGIGGGIGGFNYLQDVVLNIRKPNTGSNVDVSGSSLLLRGSVEVDITANVSVTMKLVGAMYPGYQNNTAETVIFDQGAQFIPVDNPNATPIYVKYDNSVNQALPSGSVLIRNGQYGAPYNQFLIANLNNVIQDNVKYKVTTAYRMVLGNDNYGEWQIVEAAVGNYNYFYLTKSGNNVTYEDFPQMQFTVNDLSLASGLYENNAVKLSLSMTNNNNTELTRSVQFYLLDNRENKVFEGDCFVQTLSANESLNNYEWITDLTRLSGSTVNTATQYYPAIYDIDTQSYYYISETPWTMQPTPGNPTVSVETTIPGAELIEDEEYDIELYVVENSSSFPISMKVNVEDAMFSEQITVYIFDPFTGAIIQKQSLPIEIIEAGNTITLTPTIYFPDAVIGTIYALGPSYSMENNGSPIIKESDAVYFRALNNVNGVEQLIADGNGLAMVYDKVDGKLHVSGANGVKGVEVYSLNGMKLAPQVEVYGNEAVVDLSALGKGVVVVTAVDNNGNRKSMKVAM